MLYYLFYFCFSNVCVILFSSGFRFGSGRLKAILTSGPLNKLIGMTIHTHTLTLVTFVHVYIILYIDQVPRTPVCNAQCGNDPRLWPPRVPRRWRVVAIVLVLCLVHALRDVLVVIKDDEEILVINNVNLKIAHIPWQWQRSSSFDPRPSSSDNNYRYHLLCAQRTPINSVGFKNMSEEDK